jgi:hypothetical protein
MDAAAPSADRGLRTRVLLGADAIGAPDLFVRAAADLVGKRSQPVRG